MATKKSDSGIDRPAVPPADQLVPAEFRRAAGTNTRYCPLPSTYRYGFSRLTGVLASVVYGPPQLGCAGKHWAGAPVTPEKTWFHTPLLQLVRRAVADVELLLRAVDHGAVERASRR